MQEINVKQTFIFISIFAIITLTLIPAVFPLLQLQDYDKQYLYATTAVGFSMYPTIHNGDLLVVSTKFTIQVGNIYIYSYKNITVAHRLQGITYSYYIFKGDNNDYYEEVPKDEVIGEVVEIISSDNPVACFLIKETIGV